MGKKLYEKPTIKVVKWEHQAHLLQTSHYKTTGGTGVNAMDAPEDL